MKTLRLILGDQLNSHHSWFRKVDPHITYVMMEVRQETDYTTHHIQKVVAFFLAMRRFCTDMQNRGHQIIYIKLDDPENLQSISENLIHLINSLPIEKLEYQLPDEYRLDQQLHEFCQTLEIPWEAVDSEHFYTSRDELASFFRGKKTFLMESFYRHMRKKHGVLMNGTEPVNDQWNFDHENRKSFPDRITFPERDKTRLEILSIIDLIRKCGVKTIGTADEASFPWPVSREEALVDLEFFCERLLIHFGQYQDAMHHSEPFGFHSLLSFALNVKLISPGEVIQRVIQEWEYRPDEIPYASVEGFVRQIIGWREYMRGIYWSQMPDFGNQNFLNHHNPLPRWYWDGNTKMNCLKHAVGQSLEHAYAHHIQRLMITGNFALLAMVHPDEVDQWYLGIYIDAIEWVEITNTRGMSQFADGGLIGTKPYVSSANYIHKMSNYCKGCYYDNKLKTGHRACPFNSLYWNFYDHYRSKLEKNPRIGMMYRTWDKMSSDQKVAILRQADYYLKNVNDL